MKTFHTHTYRCQHADGDINDYLKEADKQNGEVVGFTDHTPYPDGRWSETRMKWSDLDDYLGKIEKGRTDFPKLKIYKGFECEWHKDFRNIFEDELLFQRKIDYLVGAEHWVPWHGSWISMNDVRTAAHLKAYSDNLTDAISSGLFAFIAHPDIFSKGYNKWDKNTEACAIDILTAAEEFQIPLEINGYGFRKKKINNGNEWINPYPRTEFWQIASSFKIKVICNSDAHTPKDIYASIDTANNFAEEHSLAVISDLSLNYK